MYFSKKLGEFKNLKHCFFSRKNGISEGVYKSLNCGLGSNDSNKNVLKNLKIVSDTIGCKDKSLITLNQIHGSNVIQFKNENSVKNKLSGDAIISEVKNVAIGILTADCVPILFYEKNRKIIGCIHSGWKGALKEIIKNTINLLIEKKCNPEDLVFAIGPCIEKESYEVGQEIYQKFINKNEKYFQFFHKKANSKYNFDLRGLVNHQLLELNVKKIDNIVIDTFANKETFFSYRRCCVRKESDYGRCISVILMT